jgi:hypothetical protein
MCARILLLGDKFACDLIRGDEDAEPVGGRLGSVESIAKPTSKVGFAILFLGACVKSLVIDCAQILAVVLCFPMLPY